MKHVFLLVYLLFVSLVPVIDILLLKRLPIDTQSKLL